MYAKILHWHSHSYDIKFLEAKISGYDLLRLNKDSLEQFRLSTDFQAPLIKIIEEVVCHVLHEVLFDVLSCHMSL